MAKFNRAFRILTVFGIATSLIGNSQPADAPVIINTPYAVGTVSTNSNGVRVYDVQLKDPPPNNVRSNDRGSSTGCTSCFTNPVRPSYDDSDSEQ